nr:unnamed protein product [Spirometra erinaceieuropaei]
MHPGRLLPHQQAEEGVGQRGAVFSAGLQEKTAIVVPAGDSVRIKPSSPGSAFCPTAEDGGEVGSPERQTQAHQSVIDVLRHSSYDAVPDGKRDARVPSLCLRATAPEESIVRAHILQLAFFGEPRLTQCGDVPFGAHQFLSD